MARFTLQICNGSSVSMTAGVNLGGPRSPKNESAMASEVGITLASYYANWGGEFVDDAVRTGEQPLWKG